MRLLLWLASLVAPTVVAAQKINLGIVNYESLVIRPMQDNSPEAHYIQDEFARDAKDVQGSKQVYFEVMKVVVKQSDGTVFFEY